MRVTYEQREGRITEREWRVVVTVGARSATGAWCYTKADAKCEAEALRRSLFNGEESERQLEANSQARCARIRQLMESDRRMVILLDGAA